MGPFCVSVSQSHSLFFAAISFRLLSHLSLLCIILAAQLRAEATAGMASETARLVAEAAAEKTAAAALRRQLEDSRAAWGQERTRLLKDCEV